jgi:hypothetical protein
MMLPEWWRRCARFACVKERDELGVFGGGRCERLPLFADIQSMDPVCLCLGARRDQRAALITWRLKWCVTGAEALGETQPMSGEGCLPGRNQPITIGSECVYRWKLQLHVLIGVVPVVTWNGRRLSCSSSAARWKVVMLARMRRPCRVRAPEIDCRRLGGGEGSASNCRRTAATVGWAAMPHWLL